MIINKNLCEILALLDTNSEISVNAIAKELKLGQPLISKRLRELRDAKLISFRREGNTVFYFLNEEYYYSIIKKLLDVYFELMF